MAGRDLDLDFAITLCECGTRFSHQRVGRWLDAERDAGGDLAASATKQPREGYALAFRLEHPHAHLDSGLRHPVAAEILIEHRMHVAWMRELAADHAGRDPLTQGIPCRVDCFGAVVRQFQRDTLAPHRHAVHVAQFQQRDSSFRAHARRNPERLSQRQADFVEGDLFETSHCDFG